MIGWLAAYMIVWIVHFALFGMQRASLLISRKANVEWSGGGELLLPRWNPLVAWSVITVKWVLVIAMAYFWSWKYAIGVAFAGYLLSIACPIPYSIYKGIFRRRAMEIMHIDPEVGTRLLKMVIEAPF